MSNETKPTHAEKKWRRCNRNVEALLAGKNNARNSRRMWHWIKQGDKWALKKYHFNTIEI